MSRRVLLIIGGVGLVAMALATGIRTWVSPDPPYDPLVFPVQTVLEVTPSEVVIEGALCNIDDRVVEAEVALAFDPETRGRANISILESAIQTYGPGCEVHHSACSNPGDNGLCPISICQERIEGLPDTVIACAPPFVNTFTDEVLSEAEFSPSFTVSGSATPLSPQNGEIEPITSEVFQIP